MDVDKILEMDCSEEDKLGMLFSNRIDAMFQGNAAITIKKWDELFKDLIVWKNKKLLAK